MAKQGNGKKRVLDARPDTVDFRDKMYEATLIEVPPSRDLGVYTQWNVPILDQGQEGACTGFGLATVAHYLLLTRKSVPDATPVSPRMFYEMAKRYDEWPGEAYSGSSARGAMKGWHKHGVCSARAWPYAGGTDDRTLTRNRADDARTRPLGAYFRVNHRDLVGMHAAISEAGILYATATVHEGWQRLDRNGVIPWKSTGCDILGGHAFPLVAYDKRGFWIQNSWGPSWGEGGFALITYDDWLSNGTDVWVARLGVPVQLATEEATAITRSAAARAFEGYAYSVLRPHIVSLGNDGDFNAAGSYATTREGVAEIFANDLPSITKGWKKKRILLYAHGGLVGEGAAVQRVADYLAALIQREIYLLSFVWHSDLWSTVTNMIKDALQLRRPEGILDNAKDFMLDRLDDTLEPLVRVPGKACWDEMKENAILATTRGSGGARFVVQELAKLRAKDPGIEIHMVGHSAGSIFHAPIVQLLCTSGTIGSGPMKGETGLGLPIESCTLWAPACTTRLFKQTYLPAIETGDGGIKRFALFTLDDMTEKDDDCANIYHKSLLYLVSHAFEESQRLPFSWNGHADGEPLLGMEKVVRQDAVISGLFKGASNAKKHIWVLSPNTKVAGSAGASSARHHGSFDDDVPAWLATVANILDVKHISEATANLEFRRSSSKLAARRRALQA